MEILPEITYSIKGEHIIEMINALSKRMLDFAKEELKKENGKWVKQEQAMKILCIGETNFLKMQTLRNKKLVKFKKDGRIYKYWEPSLQQFMNS